MATPRLTMKNIREILRQKWALGRTHREVAQSVGVSAGAVGKVVGKADEAGLTWADVERSTIMTSQRPTRPRTS